LALEVEHFLFLLLAEHSFMWKIHKSFDATIYTVSHLSVILFVKESTKLVDVGSASMPVLQVFETLKKFLSLLA